MGMLDGLLGGIGQGLRAGSGVLNEQVFQNNEALRQNQMQAAEARKAQMFQYVWEGIQGGAIDPQKGLQAMAQIDPRATEQMLGALGQGGIGPGIAAQNALAEQQRALQERAAQDQLAQKYGLPAGSPPNLIAKAYEAMNPKAAAPLEIERLITTEREARASGDISRANALAAIIRKKGHIPAPARVGETRGDIRDRKIASLVAQGLTQADAANVIDGVVDVKINETTGRIVLTDKAKGTAREVAVSGAGPERAAIPQGEGLYARARQGVTGALPAAKEAASRITGQVGLPVAKKTTELRQELRTAQGDMIRGLAINPKLPVAEIKRIQEEINIAPSVLDSDESLQARMRSVDKSLRRRLAQAERDANDPGLPETLRSAQSQNASAMRNFLDLLAVPQEGGGWSIEEVP